MKLSLQVDMQLLLHTCTVGAVCDMSQKGGAVEYVNTYMQVLFLMF